MITNQYTLDLSCVKNNRSFFADQEYRKVLEENKNLKIENKELSEQVKLYNSLSRKRKK